ncbi:hypothetical protein [Bdellovibrio sp. HCB288]|uniref:hypothetical protein n=1 Tax=Bdellovibrio sp. HCB288 TaxID=3394355 RepID=UPI0039B683F8
MKKLSKLILTIAMTLTASLAKADVSEYLPNDRSFRPVHGPDGEWHFGQKEIPGKQVLAMKFPISLGSGWQRQSLTFYGTNVNIVGMDFNDSHTDCGALWFAVNREMEAGLGESVVTQGCYNFEKRFEITIYYTAIDDSLPASPRCFPQAIPFDYDLKNFPAGL